MKRIFYLYRDATQLLGQHRVYLKPELFNDALAFASRGLFDHYYGNTEEYRPGHPLPRVAYEVTTAVADALHPFLREAWWGSDQAALQAGYVVVGPDGAKVSYQRLEPGGRFLLPADWVHPTSWATDDMREAPRLLDDNEVAGTVASLICPPDLAHPMLHKVPGGMKLLGGAPALRATYLGFPDRAEYKVDYPDDGSEPVYDDAASVDTQWPPARDNQLLTRLVQYPALGLRDQVVQAVGQQLEQRGS